MRIRKIKVGDILQNSNGIYEITRVNINNALLCEARECLYNNDEDLDAYELGEIKYFTSSEVKACFKFQEGLNIDLIETED